MVPHSDLGVLFARSHRLDDGLRVRLRLARPGDEPPIAGLLDRVGLVAGDLDLARLVRFDPRRRAVVCATALVAGAEHVIGFGMISVGHGQPSPEALVVDPERADAVRPLLARGLDGWARTRLSGTAA